MKSTQIFFGPYFLIFRLNAEFRAVEYKKYPVYFENDDEDLNNLICQVIVVTTTEIHDKTRNPMG